MEQEQLFFLNIEDGEDKSLPFKNRIRKNYKHLRKWAKRTRTNCFRIYERDIPRVPITIDYYDGRFCVQYYSKNKSTPEPSPSLVEEVASTLTSLFNINEGAIYWRTRTRREKTEQYEKMAETKEFFPVVENGVQFWVNLEDYLDTGLFLDHRDTRQIVAKASAGKKLLNLFAYTCSFSVHAAVAGAAYTKSVDMSNTYTDWGIENFRLNNLSLKTNDVVRADCLRFLEEDIQKGFYDVIIIDPPTISRSKKMERMFDIQKDYDFLIKQSLLMLKNDGVLFFSTNSQKFTFDSSIFPKCQIVEITKQTIPPDISPKAHRCWKIQKN